MDALGVHFVRCQDEWLAWRPFWGVSMMRSFERVMGALVASIALLLGGAIAALPAQAETVGAGAAAVNYCNNASGSIQGMPLYIAPGAGTGTNKCYQNPDHYTYVATRAIQLTYNQCYASRYPGGLPSGATTLVRDGDYGAETAAAVWNMQDYHGIFRDGLYGPNTASVTRFYGGDSGGCHVIG
ncbi:peptidoglycan-binding protein [Promicromonospora sp. NPDC019610]|uniref:peptidoglycan-binding protein n=1 Tax=Promicromonospora sp. NPDC019610 TaxID=3364405 RepID=UPI003792B108